MSSNLTVGSMQVIYDETHVRGVTTDSPPGARLYTTGCPKCGHPLHNNKWKWRKVWGERVRPEINIMRLEEVSSFLSRAMRDLKRKTGALVATVCYDDHFMFVGVGVWYIKPKDAKDWREGGDRGLPPKRWSKHLPLKVE